MERGLAKSDMRKMTVGEIVDFVSAYNDRQKSAEEKAEKKKKVKRYRFATPEETSAYNRT